MREASRGRGKEGRDGHRLGGSEKVLMVTLMANWDADPTINAAFSDRAKLLQKL